MIHISRVPWAVPIVDSTRRRRRRRTDLAEALADPLDADDPLAAGDAVEELERPLGAVVLRIGADDDVRDARLVRRHQFGAQPRAQFVHLSPNPIKKPKRNPKNKHDIQYDFAGCGPYCTALGSTSCRV